VGREAIAKKQENSEQGVKRQVGLTPGDGSTSTASTVEASALDAHCACILFPRLHLLFGSVFCFPKRARELLARFGRAGVPARFSDVKGAQRAFLLLGAAAAVAATAAAATAAASLSSRLLPRSDGTGPTTLLLFRSLLLPTGRRQQLGGVVLWLRHVASAGRAVVSRSQLTRGLVRSWRHRRRRCRYCQHDRRSRRRGRSGEGCSGSFALCLRRWGGGVIILCVAVAGRRGIGGWG
jgi:hypothetical protein